MSGHSRWSQIKRHKAITDQKRGQLFSKLSKLIYLAALKGTDPSTNLDLKNAIDKARSSNMPADNIQRTISKVGDKSASQLEELNIDAIGPNNIAIRLKAITDNRNRTIAEIKKIFSDHRTKMVSPGSINWMFSQSLTSTSPAIAQELNNLLEALDNQDDVQDIITNLND